MVNTLAHNHKSEGVYDEADEVAQVPHGQFVALLGSEHIGSEVQEQNEQFGYQLAVLDVLYEYFLLT